MNYQIIPVFAEPICYADIDEEFCEPLRKYKGMEQDNPQNPDFNILDKVPKVKNKLIEVFSDFINLHILNTPNQKYTITSSWITENRTGADMGRHKHLNSYYSSVLYFDEVAEEHAPLTFETTKQPRGFYVKSELPANIYNCDEVSAPMSKGKIIFFPSYIFHFHRASLPTNIPRRSLACNYVPINFYGSGDSSIDTRTLHG